MTNENSSAKNTVDQTITTHVAEIKALPYAKYLNAEDGLERNFGYKIIRQQVSSGRNSVIYKCQHSKMGEFFCIVKAYKMGREKVKATLKEETVQIMRHVSGKCPQVISTLDVFYTNEKLYLMSDWSARGELLQLMRNKSLNLKFTEEVLQRWTTDILNGVSFLHSNAICHRNIAPNCLLVTAENRVKIGTLSDAVVYAKLDGSLIKQKWVKFSRTSNWNQGPEVAKGKLYDPRRADIWSIGATIFWFITRQHPIDYKRGGKMTKQLNDRLSNMRKVSGKCGNFVKKMLSFQPSSRPTINDALQLDWITSTSSAPTSIGKKEQENKEQAVIDVDKAAETGEAAGPEDTAPAAENETSAGRQGENSGKETPEDQNNQAE